MLLAATLVTVTPNTGDAGDYENEVHERLTIWIAQDPSRAWLYQFDLENPEVVNFLLDRVPGFQFFEEQLKTLATRPRQAHVTVINGLGYGGDYSHPESEDMRDLYLSSGLITAILQEAIANGADPDPDWDEVTYYARELEKLRETGIISSDAHEELHSYSPSAMALIPILIRGKALEEEADALLENHQKSIDALKKTRDALKEAAELVGAFGAD